MWQETVQRVCYWGRDRECQAASQYMYLRAVEVSQHWPRRQSGTGAFEGVDMPPSLAYFVCLEEVCLVPAATNCPKAATFTAMTREIR